MELKAKKYNLRHLKGEKEEEGSLALAMEYFNTEDNTFFGWSIKLGSHRAK